MGVLGLMAIRGPGVLDAIDKWYEKFVRGMFREATSSEERWNASVAEMKRKGHCDAFSSWKEMHDFVRSDDYTIKMGQNRRMSLIVDLLSKTPRVALATEMVRRRIVQ
jgi:hypothetical protein